MTPTQVTQSGEYSNTGRLYIALELSAKKWRLAVSDGGSKVRDKVIAAGDRDALLEEAAKSKARFDLPDEAEVRTVYEAGREAFWVHRFVRKLGFKNIVIDPASMKVDRKARRAKSDRIDVREMLRDLIRHHQGEKNVWRVVRVPSPVEEDNRRPHRHLGRLKKERTQHRARISSLLATQGIPSESVMQVVKDLDNATTPTGEPFGPGLKGEIRLEKERLDLVEAQIKQITKEQSRSLEEAASPALKKVRSLAMLRGVGVDSAWLLVMEFFSWRDFRNRRQVGGAAGLGGTPYSSGSTQREQGISKAGNARVRTRMIELAWLWLRYQPNSKLSQWYRRRFADGGTRLRKVGIVAMARRLLIELWQFVESGVVPQGAIIVTDK